MKIIRLIKRWILKILTSSYLRRLRKGVTKNDFSIISNDCCGGIIYHRLGKKFSSPFINLFINHSDFIELISNIDFYLNEKLLEEKSELNYPVGLLGKERPIKIHFMHYSNFNQAKECWERRKQRIIPNKIIVIFNLTNSLEKEYVDQCVTKMENMSLDNYLVLSRFDSSNPNVVKIDFSDLPEFHNAQILAPRHVPYKLHIDQINYKKVFNKF